MTDSVDPVEQIKADVAELQAASANAAEQIAQLTDLVLELQAGTTVSDEQVANLHQALADVTAELVAVVGDSESQVPESAPADEDEADRR